MQLNRGSLPGSDSFVRAPSKQALVARPGRLAPELASSHAGPAWQGNRAAAVRKID